jgi:CRISPR/Cas system-associated exonuclease Cas4 (RecB family)
MDTPRKRPYIWVSWLTKLLSGEDKCWWRAWYKAHYKYEKLADDADRADFFREWTAKHDAITQRRAAELKKDGWVTRCEEDAEFKLNGASADVAGKPDLVGLRDGEALVIDAKSGRRRASDHWQVLIYMFALPISWLKGVTIRGEVEYQDGTVLVRALDRPEREAIIQAIKTIGGPDEPARVPSTMECKYCDVAACPDRRQASTGDASRFF